METLILWIVNFLILAVGFSILHARPQKEAPNPSNGTGRSKEPGRRTAGYSKASKAPGTGQKASIYKKTTS